MSGMCCDCKYDAALPGKDRCRWCELDHYERVADMQKKAAKLTEEHQQHVIDTEEAAA